MKESLLKEEATTVEKEKEVQEKILVLTNFGLTWREIALLTKIQKRIIKCSGKGNPLPKDVRIEFMLYELDTLIDRLDINRINKATYSELCLEDVFRIKLDVNSVALYKGTDDKQIYIQVRGVKSINKGSA